MTIDNDDLLNSIIESLDRIQYVKLEDIPNIDLYMDQVTTFMDTKLKSTKRNPDDDKILTKTMINNYAKNNLIPPPVKKKYTKEHMIVLLFIYYYKGILSINDIQTILTPVTEHFFQDEEFNLSDIYQEVFGLEKRQVEILKQDVIDKFTKSKETFEEAPEESRDFLQLFSFICMLSFDVYVKKLLIEKMVDNFGKVTQDKKKNLGKKEKNAESSGK